MRPALVVRRAADYLSRHDVESPLPTAEILMASVLGTDRAGDVRPGPGPVHRRGQALRTGAVPAVRRRSAAAPDRRSAVPPAHPDRPARGVHPTAGDGDRRRARARGRRAACRRRSSSTSGRGPARSRSRSRTSAPMPGSSRSTCRPRPSRWRGRTRPARRSTSRSCRGICSSPCPADLRGSVDLVVSNPPYVEQHELSALPREVLADPMLALAGGIDVYERLFAQAAEVLRPGGAVVVEIGESQGSAVRAAATAAGFVSVEVEHGSHRSRPDRDGADAGVAWIRSPTPSRPFARAADRVPDGHRVRHRHGAARRGRDRPAVRRQAPSARSHAAGADRRRSKRRGRWRGSTTGRSASPPRSGRAR